MSVKLNHDLTGVQAEVANKAIARLHRRYGKKLGRYDAVKLANLVAQEGQALLAEDEGLRLRLEAELEQDSNPGITLGKKVQNESTGEEEATPASPVETHSTTTINVEKEEIIMPETTTAAAGAEETQNKPKETVKVTLKPVVTTWTQKALKAAIFIGSLAIIAVATYFVGSWLLATLMPMLAAWIEAKAITGVLATVLTYMGYAGVAVTSVGAGLGTNWLVKKAVSGVKTAYAWVKGKFSKKAAPVAANDEVAAEPMVAAAA